MKKIYPIITIIILIAVIACLCFFKGTTGSGSISNNVSAGESAATTTTTVSAGEKIFNLSELFTDRDLAQSADTSNATKYEAKSGENITINSDGVYVISGEAQNVTIYVEAADDAKVQLVLDNLKITNETMPCIYVKTADKVFVTLEGESSLEVTNDFAQDGENNLTGVIFSKEDITLNGSGSLNIKSTYNGIVGKDDLKITGGTYNIEATKNAIKANDSIRIKDGTLNLKSGTDGLHSENDDDSAKGYIYIGGGTLNIEAEDDAIHAQTVIEVDDGKLTIKAYEGIEATYIQINEGDITIDASDDGINAGAKSEAFDVVVEINGGTLNITMGPGDTDAIDANGSIYVIGGEITITAQSAFDFDGKASHTGGTITVNGEQIDEITTQMMGGPGGGRKMQQGMSGDMPEGMPENMPEDMQNVRPEDMPEGMQMEKPEEMTEEMKEKMKENRPERPEGGMKGNRQKMMQEEVQNTDES